MSLSSHTEESGLTTLLIEDNAGDRELITGMLDGIKAVNLDEADSLEKGFRLLGSGKYNSILLDLNLPDSSGVNTLVKILIAFPDQPVVVLTGYDESDLGILAMQSGAQDFLNKQDISTHLLLHSLSYAVERNKLMLRLKQSLREIERLRGLLPICMKCKKIRNDSGYWEQIEKYLAERSSVKFTHGLCPECCEAFLKESIEQLQAAPVRR
ncbi:MAG: response regulator [Kiritimatiellia bacterium]